MIIKWILVWVGERFFGEFPRLSRQHQKKQTYSFCNTCVVKIMYLNDLSTRGAKCPNCGSEMINVDDREQARDFSERFKAESSNCSK